MKYLSSCIHFANRWALLLSEEKTNEWLEEFSFIMGLTVCNREHSHKIILYRDDGRSQRTDDILLKCGETGVILPVKGWNVRRIYSSYFLTHPYSNISIFHYGYGTGDRYAKMMFLLVPVFDYIISAGGLPIHGALIKKEGSGFILAGKSTSGKSTCCSRLNFPWEVMCDDLTLIVKEGEGFYPAHPLPTWSRVRENQPGSSWNTAEYVPLKKLFFLEKSEKDEVIPVNTREGAMKIFYLSLQVYTVEGMKKEEMIQKKQTLFETAWELAVKIPCYRLRVSAGGAFWNNI